MSESQHGSPNRPPGDELQPLALRTKHVIVGGTVAWLVALALTLMVPALHQGDRQWWPWTCVAGIALGAFGYAYVRRGRGNASDAL
ncbi:MAG TPA: DUF2530 domain-containing protein [Pedococcus sp.]|nr:DUF2530 domain-containing protein [Pedococcus sp.]